MCDIIVPFRLRSFTTRLFNTNLSDELKHCRCFLKDFQSFLNATGSLTDEQMKPKKNVKQSFLVLRLWIAFDFLPSSIVNSK